MKPSATITSSTATLDVVKAPNFVKVTAITIVSFSVITLLYLFPSSPFPSSISFSPSFSITSPQQIKNNASLVSPRTKKTRPPPPPTVGERTGIVDENGAMAEDFVIGEFDPSAVDEFRNLTGGREESTKEDGKLTRVKNERFRVCEESTRDYIPCLDNVEEIKRLNLSGSLVIYERHCPEEGKGLDCLVPMPKGYKRSIPWPRSRDEVWFSNVPQTRLFEDKGGQNWIALKKDKFVFPGGGTQFIHGADQYLNQISEMVPEIAFGQHTRIALDIGCGVASFGAFLLQRNVTTLSIAPKDVHENQIQFALERGVPAMAAVFSTRRLLYPSQAFDLIHCSRCRIDWTRDDGILLLEVNRMLRAGGYFVWAAQPVYKHEENLQEQWKEMQDLTRRICWELVKKEGYIAIWRKPLNNSCYLSRDSGAQPPLCDSNDDPDSVWYVSLRPCITRLPENGYGANVTTWPVRLHYPPDRLQSIRMDATFSRKELFKAESKYWNEIIESYVRAFHWKQMNFRNVMDMRAGFGGFAAALHDLDSYFLPLFHNNLRIAVPVPIHSSGDHEAFRVFALGIVPAASFITVIAPVPEALDLDYEFIILEILFPRCETFDTYPRTYDLLHAAGLFSAEQKRHKCKVSSIMLEMDRMLRPGGTVYIRDSVSVMSELQEIATATRWVCTLRDTGEGPHASWKILTCDKRMP
ncbi:hypothetical protein POTOM_007702 [Populus tomentosa]|uniref:Methyltransferase n=1 Tax=Populus tomentosa TaxID=118781 RepID=A0A8X8AKM1_POPTO|nr:hypothetical protein POTOM_007702 [Populus tomentosa]